MRDTTAINERCQCSAAWAWLWVDDIVEEALGGNEDYARILPSAIEHALGRRSECPVVPEEMVPMVIAWVVHSHHAPDVATWCPYCPKGARE